MTVEQETTADPLRPNVKTFQASGFQGTEWEVVSRDAIPQVFESEQFNVVDLREKYVDPMFENYDADPTIIVVPLRSSSTEEEDDGSSVPSSDEVAASASVHVSAEHADTDCPTPSESPAVVSHDEAGGVADVKLTQLENPTGLDNVSDTAEQDVAPESHPAVRDDVSEAILQDDVTEQHAGDTSVSTPPEEEMQRLVEEARQTGISEGRSLGQREGEEKLKALEQRYAAVIDDLSEQIRQGIELVERKSVDFALQVAKKLIGTTVEVNPEYIITLVREAIKTTGGAAIKAVRVNPRDLEILSQLPREKLGKERDAGWAFEGDETIRAGCVVETSAGDIDFDLEKAWERIRATVVKVG